MKMAFELNDLKGFLFLVLFTIPSTSSTNYDCKGKSFYCLDSTHFLICVDFGGGVLSTIDDFVLPCPSLTECHESNTYECELPKIETTTAVYTTSVTEKNVNSVVPLINTATTVPPELTTVLPSTEKSAFVPVSEVPTSESNKEILENLKDQFTGGNEHVFEPTKFITSDSIGLSPSVDNVNRTTTAVYVTRVTEKSDNSVVPLINIATTVAPELTTVLPSTEKSTVVPVSEVATSESNKEILENLKDQFTGGNEHIFDPTKFIPSDSTGLSPSVDNVNKTTTAVYATSVTEKSDNSVVPLINTVTTVPPELTTLPSTEKSTVVPVSEIATSESNKEILENLKDQFTGGNEHVFEPATFIPSDSIGLSPSVDNVNRTATAVYATSVTEKSGNSVVPLINTATTVAPELTTVLPSTDKITVVPVSEVATSESNKEILENLKDQFTGGNEHVFEPAMFIPSDSIGLNLGLSPSVDNVNKTTTAVYATSVTEKSDNSVVPLINTAITVPPELTTVLPSTEKSTIVPVSEVAASESNKEILENLKDQFTGGNEHVFEPTKFIPSDSIGLSSSVDNVNKSTTAAYATNVTEKSNNSVVPLINTVTTVPPDLTTALLSTEKSTVVPVSEVATSESNKEILENFKDQFTGGNEYIFEPTKFILPDNIVLSPSVDDVNKKSTTFVKNKSTTANVETSSENKVNNSIKAASKIMDVTTSFEGLLVTDSNEAKIYTPKSLNITYNNTDKIELNITANELTKSKNLTSDEGQTMKPFTISPNLSSDGVNVNSVSETTHVSSSTNTVTTVPPEVTTVLPSTEKDAVTTVPLEVTTVLPSTEKNTVTTVPLEVTTVQPSTEKNTAIPALDLVIFESNKEILEKLKDELTGGNEKNFGHTSFVPPSSISLSPSVDKVNKMNTTTDKNFNPKPGIETSTENTMKMIVIDNSKIIDVTPSVEGLLIADFKEANSMSKSPNITHNSTNNREFNITTSELTKSKDLTGDKALGKTWPASSSNLNTDEIYLITLSEMSDKSAINTVTIGPPEIITVLPSTEKNTVIPALEVVTSNKEILESLKDEFTGGNERKFEPTKFKPTSITSSNPPVDIVSEKNNPKPDISTEDINKIVVTDSPKNIEVTTSIDGLQATDFIDANFIPNFPNIVHNSTNNKELNIPVSELTKSENLTSYEAGAKVLPTSSSNINTDGVNVSSSFETSDNSVVPIKLTTVLPSTYKNTFTPALEVTTFKLNKEILENFKDEFTEHNEKIFKPTTSVLPHSISSNPSVEKLNEINITTDKNINYKESIETSTETTKKISVTSDSKIIEFGTAAEGILITELKNGTYTPTLQNNSYATIATKELNITDNLTSDKALAKEFLKLSPNLNSDQRFYLNNIVSFSNQTNYYYSLHNLTTPTITNEVTLDPIAITEKVLNITEMNKNLNTNPITDNIGRNLAPEKQKDFLSNELVQLEKTTTITPLEISSPTVIPINHLQIQQPNGSEIFLGTSDTLNTTASTNKYEAINNIDVIYTTISTTEPIANIVDNQTRKNLDVFNNNGVNTYRTTVLNNEPTTEVTSTTHKDTTPTETQIFVSSDNSLTTPIPTTTHESISTTVSSTTIESSFTPLIDSVITPDIYAINNEPNVPKMDATKKVPIDVQVKSTTTLSMENSVDVTPSPQFVVKTSSKLFNVKESSLEKQINITTSDTIYVTAFTTAAPQSKTYEIKSEHVNNLIVTTSENVNTKSSKTNDSENWNNTYFIKANNLSIIPSLTTEKPYGDKEENNVSLNYEIADASALESSIAVSSTTKSSVMIKDQAKNLIKNNVIDSSSVTITSTLSSPHKINVATEATTSFTINGNIDNKPIEAPSKLEAIINADTITEVVTPSPNINNMKINIKNLTVIQIKNAKPTVIDTETTAPDLKTSEYIKEHKEEQQMTVPVSHDMLHSETTTQVPMEVIKTQTTYHSNIFVSPAVTEFTVEQNPNIMTNKIPLAIMISTGKPNVDNSSRISTVQITNMITNNNNENISIMPPVSIVEKLNIRKPKSVLGSPIFTENIFNNDTANNSTYSTNIKIRNKSNTRIKETLQTNTQNMTFAYKIQGNNTNKEDMNLETATNAMEKALLDVDIGGKIKNENDYEDNESSTPYKSASHIELTTPSTLDYGHNKPVVNTANVTPQSRKSETPNTNISDTQINQRELKPIQAKTKVPRAAIEGKINNSITTFDCRNKTRGKYGDSKDCQKFYICIGTLQPIVGICPDHTVFSEINKQCTRNLSHCIRNNQFHCLYEGRFSDFFKDNVYYICVKNNVHGFLRYKLQCQGGYYLNKATVKCEKIVEVYKESVSSINENSKIINDQSKSVIKSDESEKSVSNDFECKKEGLFPYTNDCRKYYVCSKNSKQEYRRKIKKCSRDEVYDKEKKKCVYADSIEC